MSNEIQESGEGLSSQNLGREFSRKILRYFLTFLQTDFKKQQAPRRRIQLKTDAGFRVGIPLRKYHSLYTAIWKLIGSIPQDGLVFRIAPGKYTAPISPTLLDLINQHIEAIEKEAIDGVAKAVLEYVAFNRAKSAENPESFVESVQTAFVEETGTRIVQPLLSLLDGPFREVSYSAIESIYDVEADFTDVLCSSGLEALPSAINTIVVTGDYSPIQSIFDEFFRIEDIKAATRTFFGDFATSDVFQEIRDLQHSLRSAENQSAYLYLGELRTGHHSFPLFFIPARLAYDEETREFLFEFDPHLYVNKLAVDWILQEKAGDAKRVPVSPITDRVLYLDGRKTFLQEMEDVLSRLVPAFEIAANLDLSKGTLQQVSSPTLKISTSIWFAVFDKADESLLNDYEELLTAFSEEQQGAEKLFDNIMRGFIFDNPVSVSVEVDRSWDRTDVPARLVADAPIPLNEEQRKILSALRQQDCNYVSVQGPPGTGKSHTITALAFEGITAGQSVLVLSDKPEALDVVQDKLESVLSKVRHGDDDFPNPILRLGKTGSTYNRLVSASAKEKIKTHYQAASRHSQKLDQEMASTKQALQVAIAKTVDTLSGISISELEELHRLESEIESLAPGLVSTLQSSNSKDDVERLGQAVDKIDINSSSSIFTRIEREIKGASFAKMASLLSAWSRSKQIAANLESRDPLALFARLEVAHHNALLGFISEYEALRMPLFGWLFRRSKIQALNFQVGSVLPCLDPIDLHKRLALLKQSSRVLGTIKATLELYDLEGFSGFVWEILREDRDQEPNVEKLFSLVSTLTAVCNTIDGYIPAGMKQDAILGLILMASRYTVLWTTVAQKMAGLPKTDYMETKASLEQLNTVKMTVEIDRRFLEFVDNKKATAKSIGGVIKNKQKFPEDEFHHLSDAFPVIIAGIREYAEYVPLKTKLFDLVVIDEASQVSVAQALPALLRAQKVVVFGDAKQFSNVKSSQASNIINAGWLTDIEAYFRANISDAATKTERLKHFDVKKSILEFFDLIANYQTMLRKHFRGYQELISFSSKSFYDGQLQAIKIRSKSIKDVIRFHSVTPSGDDGLKNANHAEANFILDELRSLLDDGCDMTVGVITPFREQVKLLNEILFRDAYGERFESDLRLKIMTFDSCQGEERDLIIYSMVATADRDVLNYIFPVDLESAAERVDEVLKAQRLNVGFSRAKEGMLFVLSKPVHDFRGSIGRVLMHYKNILEDRARPDASCVDQNSPMERKVLDWLFKTPFIQSYEEVIEVVPQFPVGDYLKQLDPFYSHPSYRCDFLVRYHSPTGAMNVIVEYDGFAEHFIERQKIHNGNWDRYYRPEDVERQMVIESYGYKFLRLNRFNLGNDPVTTISERLYELLDVVKNADRDSAPVAQIKGDAACLHDGTKRTCPKCGEIREVEEFWDPKLKTGHGGYGRNCMKCKAPVQAEKNKTGQRRSWRSRYGWRY